MPAPNHLPGPNADVWDWQMHGLCRGVESSMFFHPDGERGRPGHSVNARQGDVPSVPGDRPMPRARTRGGRTVRHLGRLSESERSMLMKRGVGRRIAS